MTLFAVALPLPCVFHVMDYVLAFGNRAEGYKGALEVCTPPNIGPLCLIVYYL